MASRAGPSDTSPEALEVLVEGYRRMTPLQRLDRALSMTRTLKTLIEAQVRQEHPGASEREVRLRMAARWIPRELMIAAFGFDPEAPAGDGGPSDAAR